MNEEYEPSSQFLKAIVSGDAPLSGSAFAEANLRRLIAVTRDWDRSNRDWAIFLLSHENVDTAEIRAALLEATNDDDDYVRAEAIWGLANRDRDLALPLVQKALSAQQVAMPVFEAAALIAHPSLVNDLRRWCVPSDNAYADGLAAEALAACEADGTKQSSSRD